MIGTISSTCLLVQKNTISGRWEVRENGRKVVDTKHKYLAILNAETIRDSLEEDGVEVIATFDLTGA